MSRKPKIALVITGGTIDTLGDGRLDLMDYGRHKRWLEPDQLVASIPELSEIADIDIVSMGRLGSASMSTDDLVALSNAVQDAFARGADGVVVTQGTNYVEENGYFLSLTVDTERPVVLTAAMRPATAMSSDGALNLFQAVRVASTPEIGRLGTVVLMNERIHAMRDVTKGQTYGVDAFRSRTHGPLGEISADGRITLYRTPVRLPAAAPRFKVGGAFVLPRVDIILSYYGADGALIDAAVTAGAKGLVSSGFGPGRAGPGLVEAFDRAVAAGCMVVQSARGGEGRVVPSNLLAAKGWLAADDLTPWKARLLLMLALTTTRDFREIQEIFLRY